MNQIDQILKKEMSPKKKTILSIGVGMVLFYILSAVFCFWTHYTTNTAVVEQAARSIANISQLNKDSISRSIENRRLLLEMLAYRIEKDNVYDIDAVVNALEDYKNTYEFYNPVFDSLTDKIIATSLKIQGL